jgi:hypothetical protein
MIGTAPVPVTIAGSEAMTSVGDTLYLTGSYTSESQLWALDATGGSTRLPIDARSVVATGDGVIGYGAASMLLVHDEFIRTIASEVEGSPNDRVAIDPTNGDVIAYLGAMNALVRIRDGIVTARVDLGTTRGIVTNPLGQLVEVRSKPRVSDLIVDSRGLIWYLNLSTGELVPQRL